MMTRDAAQTWDLEFGAAARLHLRVESGDVVLRPAAPGEEPRLELDGPNADRMNVRLLSGAESVSIHAESPGDPSRGGAVLTLVVPGDVRASVQSDFGSITADGLGPCELHLSSDLGSIAVTGCHGLMQLATEVGKIELTGVSGSDITAHTQVGAIQLFDVEGALRLQTETGGIEGRDISGMLTAHTEFGGIKLDIARLDHGEHSVRSACGSVDVTLPRDAEVRLAVSVEEGSARIDYKSRPEAPVALHLSTDNGSVRVREGLARGDGRAPTRPVYASPTASRSERDPAPIDYDAELARILTLVAAGELSPRDANELLEAMKAGR